MPKDRHRIFEIYTDRDEAAWEMMPKGNPPAQVTTAPEIESKRLVVTKVAGITQIQFTSAELDGSELVNELKDDLERLREDVGNNSRLLIDFTGVAKVGPEVVNFLTAFNKKLQNRGSRMVLCCLEPDARAAFFAGP